MIFSSEAELLQFGEKIGKNLIKEGFTKTPLVIELIGDVGVGKTTLTRGIAKGLGVKEAITSPSFTISKRYAFGDKNLAHYDFYRLPDAGIMSEELAESISDPNVIVIIEWGASVSDILPKDHIIYRISINDDGSRTVEQE